MMWRLELTTCFRLESTMPNTDEDSVRTIKLRGLGKTVRENMHTYTPEFLLPAACCYKQPIFRLAQECHLYISMKTHGEKNSRICPKNLKYTGIF